MFATIQAASFGILSVALGPFVRLSTGLHGLAGPFVIIEGLTRFRYHSLIQNTTDLLVTAAIRVSPLAYIMSPSRLTLYVSGFAIIAWILFGLLQNVHHT